MIQSATNSTTQVGLAFEGRVDAGLQAGKRQVGGGTSKGTSAAGSLTPEQQRQVDQLKQADQKVRAHEQAHVAIGADLVRGVASFTYQTGPDDKRYAVAGEVSIDASPGRTPQDTIPKAQHIRATALAPVDPSPQDHSVAAQASRMESEARLEVAVKQREKTADPTKDTIVSLYIKAASNNSVLGHVGSFLDAFA
jgi:SprA-related family